jgi:uncharacterized protein (TIGR02246 family)
MSDLEKRIAEIEAGEAWDESDEVVDLEIREPLDKVVPVRLTSEKWAAIRREARELGLGPSTLARMWILEKLRAGAATRPMTGTQRASIQDWQRMWRTGSFQAEPGINAFIEEYTQAVAACDAGRYAALFADDVTWMLPGREPATSREQVRVAAESLFRRRQMLPRIAIEALDVGSDLAAVCVRDTGTWRAADGTSGAMDVQEIWVLRSHHSKWLMVRQIWNSRSAE